MEEDPAVAGQGLDPFLDPRAAAVVEADDRHAALERGAEALDDLARVERADGSARDGEVLRVGHHGASGHRALAGDDAVAGQVAAFELATTMLHPEAKFDEAGRVEEQVQALARRELPQGVLARNFVRATARQQRGAAPIEIGESIHSHGNSFGVPGSLAGRYGGGGLAKPPATWKLFVEGKRGSILAPGERGGKQGDHDLVVAHD